MELGQYKALQKSLLASTPYESFLPERCLWCECKVSFLIPTYFLILPVYYKFLFNRAYIMAFYYINACAAMPKKKGISILYAVSSYSL